MLERSCKCIRTGWATSISNVWKHVRPYSPLQASFNQNNRNNKNNRTKKKQEDTKIPSKPDFHNESKIVDASNSESDDEQARIETTNQNSQSLTSNLTPNDQSKTIDQMPTT